MTTFKIHTAETAQAPADNLLIATESTLGFVPNLFGVLAESPTALRAFVKLNNLFAQTSFNATSREIIQIAVSVENTCNYCVAGTPPLLICRMCQRLSSRRYGITSLSRTAI